MSDVSDAVKTDSDMVAIHRWIEAVDARAALWPEAVEMPIKRGALGEVKNPLWTIIRQLDQVIDRVEVHFGMTPLARFRLQMQYAEAGLSIEALNKALNPTGVAPAAPKSRAPEQPAKRRRRENVINLDSMAG